MRQQAGISAQLNGDWTVNGVVRQIEPLVELSNCWDCNSSTVDIDCSGIEEIDSCGFQLLYTWLHCLEIRGIESKLLTLPAGARDSDLSRFLCSRGTC